jgi:hypothetical protein
VLVDHILQKGFLEIGIIPPDIIIVIVDTTDPDTIQGKETVVLMTGSQAILVAKAEVEEEEGLLHHQIIEAIKEAQLKKGEDTNFTILGLIIMRAVDPIIVTI